MVRKWSLLQFISDREEGMMSCPTCGSHRWIVDCDRQQRYFLLCAKPHCDEVFPIPEDVQVGMPHPRRNVYHIR